MIGKKQVDLLHVLSLFLCLFFSGCFGPPPTGDYYNSPITNSSNTPKAKNRTFNASYDKVWSAVISASSNIDWETEYIDKASGVIKFKTSYLITDFVSLESVRIYKYPREIDVKYGNSKPFLRKFTYHNNSLTGNVKFTKQNLVIRLKKLSPSKTKVAIKFTIEGAAFWSGNINPVSNGLFESDLLDAVSAQI